MCMWGCVCVCMCLCVCVCVCQFSSKINSFNFFRPNLSKNGLGIGNSEKEILNKNHHLQDTMYANVQAKPTTFNFFSITVQARKT